MENPNLVSKSQCQKSQALSKVQASTFTYYVDLHTNTDDYQLRDPLLFALIIGINAYQKQPHLRGAVADANAFKNYLTTSLGVDESRIISLIDQEATRAKIIEKFDFLSKTEAIQRDYDPIVIFFAGHGGDALSPPGWEAGGPGARTQFLIAHDSSTRTKLERTLEY